jgi:hypothetical protein
MKRLFKMGSGLANVIAALFALILLALCAHAQDLDRRDFLKADLSSFNQVPSVLAPWKIRGPDRRVHFGARPTAV